MQTITITPHYENGRFYFELPDDMKGSKITIQIIVNKADPESLKNEDKLQKVRPFAGIAKDSSYQPNAGEWYQQ
ncbi:MAG: hypothetical protein ACLFPE_14585 [Bacteroidales bacterium]